MSNDKKELIMNELKKLKEGVCYEGAIPEIRLAEEIAYTRAIRIVEYHLKESK